MSGYVCMCHGNVQHVHISKNIRQGRDDNYRYVYVCRYSDRHTYMNPGYLYLQILLPQVVLS